MDSAHRQLCPGYFPRGFARGSINNAGQHYIAFDLPDECNARRVAVDFTARIDHSAPSGYAAVMAIDVNGEILTDELHGRSRLINKPVTFRFGTEGTRESTWVTPQQEDFVSYTGSACWTLPYGPSVQACEASDYYALHGTEMRNVVEITDLVYPGHNNYISVRHTCPNCQHKPLVIERLRVLYGDSTEPRPWNDCLTAWHTLMRTYFSDQAARRDFTETPRWVWDMTMLPNYGGMMDPMMEIRNSSDAQRRIDNLQDKGATAVLINGCHFRYDYADERLSRILPYIQRLTAAAHAADLHTIDHHDVPLFFTRGYEYATTQGRLAWLQRDVRYGTPTRMYCINNPDFRNDYFSKMRQFQQQCGTDGYMIDEVQFFDKNFCGCSHCRRQFHEDTGLSLPSHADSQVFDNAADPVWKVFMLWRMAGIQRFRNDFLAEMKKVNPQACMVTYRSAHWRPHAGGGMWPAIYVSSATGTEYNSRMPYQNYRSAIVDLKMLRGLADAMDHASFAYFYMRSIPAARFTWAITQATGQSLWTRSNYAHYMTDLITWPERMRHIDNHTFADVAMIFSERSRSISLRNGGLHGMESYGWGIAMLADHIQYHHLHETGITADVLNRYKVVIVPQLTVISDDMADALRQYVVQGGRLVITTESGLRDEFGRPSEDFALADIMGVRFRGFIDAPFTIEHTNRATFDFTRDKMLYMAGARAVDVAVRPCESAHILSSLRANDTLYPCVIRHDAGKGSVYTVTAHLGISNFEWIHRYPGKKNPYRYNKDAEQYMGFLIRDILAEDERLSPADVPAGIVFTSFLSRDGNGTLSVHILNVQDHTRKADVPVYPKKDEFNVIDSPIRLRLRQYDIQSAVLYVPGHNESIPCETLDSDDGTIIVVPGKAMAMYGLLKITGNAL